VSLASPVMLAPNTSYYLVTSETSGGDLFISATGVQSTSIVQSIDGKVQFDTTNGWQPTLNGGVDLGAVDLVATPLPDMAGQGITSGVQVGGLGAGSGNFQGLQFTTGANPVTVSNLGRWIIANTTTTQAHTLELVDQATDSAIASTTLAAGQAGGANGQFEYAALASPVSLAANHSYYLVSNEMTTGDQVENFSQMRPSNLITSIDGFVTYNGTAWTFTSRPGFVRGPLDFLGQPDTSPVSYTIYRSTSPDMSGATPIATGLNTTSFIDTTAAAGTQYYYTVAGANQSGVGATLGEGSASLGTDFPVGWSDTDIGTPPVAGSAWTNNGSATSFTVQGSGTQSSNQWNFAYETVPIGSSFTATVELTSLSQYGGPIAGYDEYKGALMIRDGLGTTAHVAYVDDSATFTQFDGVNGDQEAFPIYFQLQASYNPANKVYTVTGYYLNSLGQPIKPFNSPGAVLMFNATNLYVGVAADSNGAAGLTTATFDNFSVVNGVDQPPIAPSNSSPANNAIGQSLTPTLTASSFSDPDAGDTQGAAEWVVTRVSDNAVIYDSGTDTADLTSIALPAGALANSVAYSWKVRYQDNHGAWSNYSAPTTFTTLAAIPVATPTFSAPAGSYLSSVSVTISDTTAGATIHYTTDGSAPTSSSPTYSTPVLLSASSMLQAIAVNAGQPDSAVLSAAYTIVAATPTFSSPAGAYTSSVAVTISDTTAGSTIHYTTNGTTPTATSPAYTVPVVISASETLSAIAIENGLTSSAVASAAYTLVVATPTFGAPAGAYTSSVSVTISDATAGSTIHFTTNGSTPTATSPTYSAPVVISASETLSAIAIENGLTNSGVASAAYTVVVATPTFSAAAGAYANSVSVTIRDATAGSTIHYTTNGATPTATSATYSTALTIASSETLKAIAIKNGLTTSAVASAAYTIAASTPVIAPAAGTYVGSVTVKITDATSGAVIHYTTDGTTPTASSPVYSATFAVSSAKTVKAIAVKSGLANSAAASAAYTFAAVAPTFSQKTGNYLNSVSVTLACATSGAAIRYTLDGSTPTASSPLYSAALTVKSTATIKAIAIKSGLATSAVSTATYTIIPSASVTTLTSGKSVTSLSAAQGVQKFFQIVVPSAKTSLTISITGGTGNADLYLRRSALPSTGIYDSRSVASGDTDTITLKSPVAGTYYIVLYGTAAYSGVTLKAIYA
jgi:LysM repeat protein